MSGIEIKATLARIRPKIRAADVTPNLQVQIDRAHLCRPPHKSRSEKTANIWCGSRSGQNLQHRYLVSPKWTKPSGFPEGFDGGAGRDRTDDLYNAIVALSQLSYGPMFGDDLISTTKSWLYGGVTYLDIS